MSAKWLQIRNEAGEGPAQILIYDQIGKSWWDDSGVAAKEFVEALGKIPDSRDIHVRINSPGGAIADGLAIYNALSRRRPHVTSFVDGYALSAASFIALAGKRVVIPENGIMMIHNPQGGVRGDSREMRKMAEILDTHKASLLSIYKEKTGKSESAISYALDSETWLTGKEAVDWGLADEVSKPVEATNCFDLSAFTKPRTITPANGEQVTTQPNGQTPVTAGASISVPPVADGQGGDTSASNKQPKEQIRMDTPVTTPAAEPVKPPTAPTAMPQPVLTPEQIAAIANSIAAAMRPAAPPVVAPPTPPTAEPLRASAVTVVGNAYDRMIELPQGEQRRIHVRNAWADLHKAMLGKTRKSDGTVYNVNTISTDLTTDLLSNTVMTAMGSRLAIISALFTEILLDPVKPKTDIQVPMVSASTTMQTDPTDWESGDTTVDAVTVTMHEYSKSWHVTNAQLQSGTQIAWLVEQNALDFADGLSKIVTAIFTVANYGAALGPIADAAMGTSDLATFWAAAKNFTKRNLVLDGGHYARLIPNATTMLSLANGAYGFDSVQYNNVWSTSAVANLCGVVVSPEAAVVAAGLPLEPPGFGTAFSSVGTGTIPGLNLRVQTASWVKPGTRVQWNAYDLMLGVAKADGDAGKLIISA